ncbi:glycosyltransferase [Corynebacterium sp. HMSC074A01]|uniref:glycosyltransferase n=1 Tax=Corynebacterium sp. HMSC074A01 TaxID=1715030 RepID=UPI0009F6DEE4|nr:glycosyltransferase [Corynebacterium sp. HMSC074A01]
MNPYFIGQTRYSLYIPRSAAWRASAGAASPAGEDQVLPDAQYKRYLYDPLRLDFRDYIFTNLTAPALASAAEGHNVVHFVTYSESLPEKYQTSLERTARRYPILKLLKLPDGASGAGEIDAYIQANVSGVYGRYRLDDDDVLAKQYFTAMARYVNERFVGTAVSLPLGIEAVMDGGQYFNFREAHMPMNSMGLLYVCQVGDDKKIIAPIAGPHDKSDRYAPVILDARQIGYLRSNHEGQDNLLRHRQENMLPLLLANMDRFPAVSSPQVIRENFPAVSDIILGDSSTSTFAVDKSLDNGWEFALEGGASGVTVILEGEAADGLRAHPVALSLELTRRLGRVAKASSVIGVATSPNSAIGHFKYFDIKPGRFRAMASVYLADGVTVRKARVVPLVEEARDISVASVSCVHNANRAVLNEVELATARRISRRAEVKKQLFSVGRWLQPKVRKVMVQLLGQGRTDSVIRAVAARLS